MKNLKFLEANKEFIIHTGYLGTKHLVKANNPKDAVIKMINRFGPNFKWTYVTELAPVV